MKLFFKTFFTTAFLSGLVMIALQLPRIDFHNAFIIGTLEGCAFGLIFSIILVPFHYFIFERSISPILEPNSFETSQRYFFDFGLGRDELFVLASDILRNRLSSIVTSSDKENYIIHARTKGSWKCQKELLTLKIERISNDMTRLEIFSRPPSKFTLLDYGKNYENILCVYQSLTQSISI